MFELGVNYLNSGHFSGFVAMAPLVALSWNSWGISVQQSIPGVDGTGLGEFVA